MRLRPRRLNAAIASLFMIRRLGQDSPTRSLPRLRVGRRCHRRRGHVLRILDLLRDGYVLGMGRRAREPTRRRRPREKPAKDDQRQPRSLAWLLKCTRSAAPGDAVPRHALLQRHDALGNRRRRSTSSQNARPGRVAAELFGSILFLVSSAFAVLAEGGSSPRGRAAPGPQIAAFNMLGSIAFIRVRHRRPTGCVPASTGDAVEPSSSRTRGTLIDAVCFFIGALLAIQAWRRAAAATAHLGWRVEDGQQPRRLHERSAEGAGRSRAPRPLDAARSPARRTLQRPRTA